MSNEPGWKFLDKQEILGKIAGIEQERDAAKAEAAWLRKELDELRQQRSRLDTALLRYNDYVALQNHNRHTVKPFLEWHATDYRDMREAEIQMRATLDADE